MIRLVVSDKCMMCGASCDRHDYGDWKDMILWVHCETCDVWTEHPVDFIEDGQMLLWEDCYQ